MSRLTSAATIVVSAEAIFTAALARLRRSGGMKSGMRDSLMGLKLFITSAYRKITRISQPSDG